MSKEILDKIYKAYQDGAQEVYVNPASLNDVNWLEASYTHPFSIAIRGSHHVPLGEVIPAGDIQFSSFKHVIETTARILGVSVDEVTNLRAIPDEGTAKADYIRWAGFKK